MSLAEPQARAERDRLDLPHPDVPAEQAHLDRIRAAVDSARVRASVDPRQVIGGPKAGAAVARDQRRRLEGLPEDGEVLLGRLTTRADDFHVGKATVFSEDKDLLCVSALSDAVADWHAPLGSVPDDVLLRRRIAVRVWSVVGITDDVDRRAAGSAEDSDMASLHDWSGDELLAELERGRSARMRDIVATIQREQYDAMTAGFDRTLVVQGGPGTGKTAVGLHRAAWMVVNDAAPTRAGLLVVGPNPAFMTYIRAVLPTLGADAVAQFDVVSLVASAGAITATDSGEAARVKGSSAMATLLETALRKRVRPLSRAVDITFNSVRIRVTPEVTAEMILAVSQRDLPYSIGRQNLRDRLQDLLWQDYLAQMSAQGRRVSHDDFSRVRRLPGFENLLDQIWPTISAPELVRSLYGMPRRLRAAADGLLDERQQHVLRRRPAVSIHEEQWTRADLVLIDEAESLLNGPPPGYGHIVLDEAQDLTPMELRAVARRCTAGELTVLGDIAQATGPVVPADWAEVVQHLGREEVETRELTTGYRVPAPVLDYAAALLARAAPGVAAPVSYRTGAEPEVTVVEDEDDAVLAALEAARRLADEDGYRTAVVAPASRVAGVVGVGRDVGSPVVDARSGDLDHPVVVLDPASVKGLEFDAVVVLEPLALMGETVRGARSLYVALTRCTQRLVVVSSRVLPGDLGSSGELPLGGVDVDAGVDSDLVRLLDLASRVPPEDRLPVSGLLERFATLPEPVGR